MFNLTTIIKSKFKCHWINRNVVKWFKDFKVVLIFYSYLIFIFVVENYHTMRVLSMNNNCPRAVVDNCCGYILNFNNHYIILLYHELLG